MPAYELDPGTGSQHPRPDHALFRREILPLLRKIPIRRGEYVPHPK